MPTSQDSHKRSNGEISLASIPRIMPLLPMRGTVVFPRTVMPVTVSRQKVRKMLQSLQTDDALVGVVAQRTSGVEDPKLADLYRIGTVCRILKQIKLQDESETLILEGYCRFGIVQLMQSRPFWKAKINCHSDARVDDKELEALMYNVRQAASRVIEHSPNVPEEVSDLLETIEQPGELADFLAANLSLDFVYKQEFLETFNLRQRLIKVNVALESQLEVLKLSEKLELQVRDQIDKTQREYYLQEQLKAIRQELGQIDAPQTEVQRLKEKIEQSHMPQEISLEALRELERLSNMPQSSAEYTVSWDYIEWLCDLPWIDGTEDRLDIKKAARILDEDHYGLDRVKRRILEFLAVRKLKPDSKGPILCFSGPPGVGKTSLGMSIARALGRKFIRMSLGGVRDEAELRGHRRTYVGALPGRIIQEIRKAKSRNPVFMLDEVDKLGHDFRGDPTSALLEVLDPQQNHTFTDHYLSVPFDLSNVMFIATANYMDEVPPPLRDRMEILPISSYTLGEKRLIAERYLLPRQINENGLKPSIFTLNRKALELIISSYTREAGVRNLERQIASICRAAAADYASGRKRRFTIQEKDVSRYLGPVQYESEVALRTSLPGVVTGLAFTPTGGEILFIEAARMPGSGNLVLTGQVGDIMRESAHAAYSVIRTRVHEWRIDEAALRSTDLHLHVPEAAVPKDGPSAGIGMLLAMVSVLRGKPIRPDIAVTGEITLRGLVLPVGGIKEKLLAGYRAGIGTIVLPTRNKKDLVELPAEARRKLKIKLVSHIDELMRMAFRSSPKTNFNGATSQKSNTPGSGPRRTQPVARQRTISRSRIQRG